MYLLYLTPLYSATLVYPPLHHLLNVHWYAARRRQLPPGAREKPLARAPAAQGDRA